MLTEAGRYERYKAWCQLLGVRPAPMDIWCREVKKIPEIFPSFWLRNDHGELTA